MIARTALQSKIGSVWIDVDTEPLSEELVYIYLDDPDNINHKGIVKRTQRLTDRVNLDFDESDNLIGIEVT